jgi:hypothetical protein
MGLVFSMVVINILDGNYQRQILDVPKMITKRKETDEEIGNNCEKIRRLYSIWE